MCATAQVRLPPQTLRFATAGRSACSARQFVASTVGSCKKLNVSLASRLEEQHPQRDVNSHPRPEAAGQE